MRVQTLLVGALLALLLAPAAWAASETGDAPSRIEDISFAHTATGVTVATGPTTATIAAAIRWRSWWIWRTWSRATSPR